MKTLFTLIIAVIGLSFTSAFGTVGLPKECNVQVVKSQKQSVFETFEVTYTACPEVVKPSYLAPASTLKVSKVETTELNAVKVACNLEQNIRTIQNYSLDKFIKPNILKANKTFNTFTAGLGRFRFNRLNKPKIIKYSLSTINYSLS